MEDVEQVESGHEGAPVVAGAANPALAAARANTAEAGPAFPAAAAARTEAPAEPGAADPADPPAYAVPTNVAWVDGEDFGMAEELYLTIVPEGRTVLLKDTARLIWHVAAEGAPDVAEEVAELVSMPVGEIRADVALFLDDLTARGLLTSRSLLSPHEP